MEVKGSIFWTTEGYRLQVPLENGSTTDIHVELINDKWFILDPRPDGGFQTNIHGQIPEGRFGIGNFNPNPIILHTAPSFGDIIAAGMADQTGTQGQDAGPPPAQINMGGGSIPKKGKQREENQEGDGGGNLRGKAPETFDGDRTKSNAFLSDLQIYFELNRKKDDVKNYYSRVLIALSFIKGPNVVNWVKAQYRQLGEDLRYAGDDEMDSVLWHDFQRRFKKTFISSTQREDAYVLMQSLRMQKGRLDEYIAEHGTLVGELNWDEDSEMSCHSFRKGLPEPLAKNIIENEGLPDTLTQWVKYAQKYHSRWAMIKALGYSGNKQNKTAFKNNQQWNTRVPKRRERDPDAMDVDHAQLTPQERERLMKSGSCFKCRKQGHLAKQCPEKMRAQEAVEEVLPKPKRNKQPEQPKDEPPSYESLLKQINACSMEERQKLLEVFSTAGSDDEGF